MDSKIPVILITGHGDVEMAVDAMRNGAFDFIEKPSSSDKLLSIIARAVEKRRLVLENQQLLANLQQENGPVLHNFGTGCIIHENIGVTRYLATIDRKSVV